MANLIVIIDKDHQRRSDYLRTIQPRLALFDGLHTARCAVGDFAAVWAVERRAPVSQTINDEGAAVIWGEAIPGPGPLRIDAAALFRMGERNGDPPPVMDGFFATVVFRRTGELTASTDPLGLFPLYYYSTPGALLLGSSPEPFRYHPLFHTELNPQGLVGILLTMHLFDGATLLRGVRRLAAGHALLWHPDAEPREVRQYRLPISNRHFDTDVSEQVDALDDTLDQAVGRHAPAGRRYGLLLSDGRDSRLLAGLLHRRHLDLVALTLGSPRDQELEVAGRVARTLGYEHRTAAISYDQFVQNAELQARWEHGANGFNTIVRSWGVLQQLHGIPASLVTGYLSDRIIGGTHLDWSISGEPISFDGFFLRMMNAWGIRADSLQRLLRRDVFGSLVQDTIARMRAAYEGSADLEAQRVWGFLLTHRQRLYIGSEAWRLSFVSWPLLPIADRQVLALAGGLPPASLARRRLQDALFSRRFPNLASLPFDRPFPLDASGAGRFGSLGRTPRRFLLGLQRRLGLAPPRETAWMRERRYWHRLYDINNPGWSAVRRRVEPQRKLMDALFNRLALDELLPPPHVPIRSRDGVVDVSGLKSLLGFILWAEDHL